MRTGILLSALALHAFGGVRMCRADGLRWDWHLDLESTIQAENLSHCTTSSISRYGMAWPNDKVFLSTSSLDDFEHPRFNSLNTTGGEQWEFDGVSDDGTQSFMFGFSRDPNWAFLGTGNLRAYAEFSLANGSRYATVDYAEESVVESCSGVVTRGKWSGRDFEYSFEIAGDMSAAKITLRNPEISSTVHMTSITPARYSDNQLWPSANASLSPVPFFYWVEPIPVARVTVDLRLEGEVIEFEGMGGHERLWHAFNWPTCIRSMLAVRLQAGPFALSLVDFAPARGEVTRVPALLLIKDGEVVFASEMGHSSPSQDHMLIQKLYDDGGISSQIIRDQVTGINIIMNSPRSNRRWEFVIRHKNIGFEYFFSDRTGGTGYSGIATGGLVGDKEWTGPSFTEVLKFPDKSWLISNNYVE